MFSQGSWHFTWYDAIFFDSNRIYIQHVTISRIQLYKHIFNQDFIQCPPYRTVMFSKAVAQVSKFTFPVVSSSLFCNGDVDSRCSAFIIINKEGWAMTAGHVFDPYSKHQSDVAKINSVLRKDPSKTYWDMDPFWARKHSLWWSNDGSNMKDRYIDRQLDICVGRLSKFDPKKMRNYPVFRDPNSLLPGTSLCRLGFPFVSVNTTYNDSTEQFVIDKDSLPIPIYPNEGMHTRDVIEGNSKNGNECLYVETSTPGFKGQSGGPIFDMDGRIYAMQVKTTHMPLNFSPTVEYNGVTMVENQFINLGLGIHPRSIIRIFDDLGIDYEVSAPR